MNSPWKLPTSVNASRPVSKGVSASEGDFHEALTELQMALHEHSDSLRKLVSSAGKEGK